MTAPDPARRVLFVCHNADWIGPNHSLILLLRCLRDRLSPGVLVGGHGAFEDVLAEEGIPCWSLPRLGIEAIPEMVRLIRREGFELVYGNNSSGSSRNALIAAKLTGSPFICHVREMGREKGWKGWGFLRLADAVIAVSEAVAESARRFVSGRRLHVVYNGVDLKDGGSPMSGPGRGPGGTLTTLGVGHVCERKGTLHAVRAVLQARDEVPEMRLVLAGSLDREPDYVQQVRNLIREAGAESEVVLAGFRRDVPTLLDGADIFLHTAVSDPHPRAVIEAMAVALPVVAFAVDGVAETVEDGVTGRLVESGDTSGLADALVRLAGDPELRVRMGAAGRARVESRFDAATTAGRVAAVIERVMSS